MNEDFRIEVAQVAALVSNLFDRIEGRSVQRQKRELNGLRKAVLKVSSGGFVNTPTIPYHVRVPPQVCRRWAMKSLNVGD